MLLFLTIVFEVSIAYIDSLAFYISYFIAILYLVYQFCIWVLGLSSGLAGKNKMTTVLINMFLWNILFFFPHKYLGVMEFWLLKTVINCKVVVCFASTSKVIHIASVVDSSIGTWLFILFISRIDEHSCLLIGFIFILLVISDNRNFYAYFLFIYCVFWKHSYLKNRVVFLINTGSLPIAG